MTVVVGFVGTDGGVMVSDSQASEDDQTKFEAPKLWEDSGLLFGYSGNTAVREPLVEALHEALPKADNHENRWKVKARLCGIHGPVISGEYSNYVPKPPPGQIPSKLAGTLLVMGRDADGYWLLDINYNNTGTFHPERGFHAIGTGSAAAGMARGLLANYEPAERSAAALKLIAYRTVAACISVLDVGVGGAVQLWAGEGDGDFVEIEGNDLDDVAHGVAQWAIIEQESLDRVLRQTEAPEPEPEAPEEQVPEPFEASEEKADAGASSENTGDENSDEEGDESARATGSG